MEINGDVAERTTKQCNGRKSNSANGGWVSQHTHINETNKKNIISVNIAFYNNCKILSEECVLQYMSHDSALPWWNLIFTTSSTENLKLVSYWSHGLACLDFPNAKYERLIFQVFQLFLLKPSLQGFLVMTERESWGSRASFLLACIGPGGELTWI